MSHTKKGERLFRWALWWGIGIVVVCLAILLVDAFNSPSSSDELDGPIMNAIYQLIYQFGIWPIIIYIGLVGPVFEEFCFRLWGNAKLWTGITSVILMSLWCLFIGWWLALIAVLCGAAILVLLRADKTKRLFALMLLSSVLFAVMHISNYDGDWFMMLVAVLHKVGMGLVASYLVINYNIFWSMLFHVLNNSILAIPLAFCFQEISTSQVVIENEDCRITLRPVLTQKADKDTIPGWVDESTYIDINTPGNIAQTLNSIAHMKDSTLCDYKWSSYPKAEIKVEMLGGCCDYTRAVQLMEEQQWIALDTVEHADSVRTMRVGDSTVSYPVERTVTIRNTYEPLAGI